MIRRAWACVLLGWRSWAVRFARAGRGRRRSRLPPVDRRVQTGVRGYFLLAMGTAPWSHEPYRWLPERKIRWGG
jgi:hypothetical protein